MPLKAEEAVYAQRHRMGKSTGKIFLDIAHLLFKLKGNDYLNKYKSGCKIFGSQAGEINVLYTRLIQVLRSQGIH